MESKGCYFIKQSNQKLKLMYLAKILMEKTDEEHTITVPEMIDKVVAWFHESKDNNIIYTYRNDEENKDVYMVALRDDDKNLIGYYEKHEYRNRETVGLYNF